MPLTNDTKKHYRAIGHNLKPVVIVAGNGLTDSVIAEIDRALEDHELIKIKIAVGEREDRKEVINQICSNCNADLVQEIGKVALLYRKAKKPKLKTSNII